MRLSVSGERSAAPGAAVAAEVTEGFDQLVSLRSQWEDLSDLPGNEPSTSFEWTAAMARHHVGPGDRCFVVRLQRDGRLLGLVPLVARSSTMLGQRLVVVGPLSEPYNTHSDLLLRERSVEVAAAFVAALFRLPLSWDCYRMARVLDESPLLGALAKALAAERRLHRIRYGLPAYYLRLPPSFPAYLAERSGKFRNHVKRVDRKLAAAGQVHVQQLSHERSFDQAYEALLEVERSSWKEPHGTAISAVTRQHGFFRDMGAAAWQAGRLHLQWMTLNGKPVAYNLGYVREGCYFYLKTSYDAAHRPLSPATYLRAKLIEGLIADGVSRFDFPGEPYEWERQWTDTIRWRRVVSIYAPSARGRALALYDRLKHRSTSRPAVTHLDPKALGPTHSQSS